MTSPAQNIDWPQSVRDRVNLRAPAFLVTIYGDIAVPRGGVLWMGTLVEICAGFGITETLVRTAVSRLVAAGRLKGEREGRRSYYRLTDEAIAEFDAASKLLYTPLEDAGGWVFHHQPGLAPEAAQARNLVSLSNGLFLGPKRDFRPGLEGLTFSASLEDGKILLPAFASSLWDISSLRERYTDMIALFSPLEDAVLNDATRIGAGEAISLRLLLVHVYRQILLQDPRLPAEALAEDWPGPSARRLFARLYLLLSEKADPFIGQKFEGKYGMLDAVTPVSEARLASLRQISAL